MAIEVRLIGALPGIRQAALPPAGLACIAWRRHP